MVSRFIVCPQKYLLSPPDQFRAKLFLSSRGPEKRAFLHWKKNMAILYRATNLKSIVPRILVLNIEKQITLTIVSQLSCSDRGGFPVNLQVLSTRSVLPTALVMPMMMPESAVCLSTPRKAGAVESISLWATEFGHDNNNLIWWKSKTIHFRTLTNSWHDLEVYPSVETKWLSPAPLIKSSQLINDRQTESQHETPIKPLLTSFC